MTLKFVLELFFSWIFFFFNKEFFYSHFSASAAISSLSVDTQTLSKTPAFSISVKEIPNNVTPSIFWIFFNLIPFDPPLARISATMEEDSFEKLSWHCTWQRCGEKNDASMSILRNAIEMKSRCDMKVWKLWENLTDKIYFRLFQFFSCIEEVLNWEFHEISLCVVDLLNDSMKLTCGNNFKIRSHFFILNFYFISFWVRTNHKFFWDFLLHIFFSETI